MTLWGAGPDVRDEFFDLPETLGAGESEMLELKLETEEDEEEVFLRSVKCLLLSGAFTPARVRTDFVGGARDRLPKLLEFSDVSLTSEVTLAESERRSSQEPLRLEFGLRLQPDDTLLGGCSLDLSAWFFVVDRELAGAVGRLGSTTLTPNPVFPLSAGLLCVFDTETGLERLFGTLVVDLVAC